MLARFHHQLTDTPKLIVIILINLNLLMVKIIFLRVANVNIYDFEGENLTWDLPKLHGLLNIDLALSNHFAVTGGVSYSKYNSENFWGNNFGVAFFDYSNELVLSL